MALTKSDKWAINDMCKSFKDERSDYIKLMSKYKADKECGLHIDRVSGPGLRYSKHLATTYTHAANRNKLKYIAAHKKCVDSAYVFMVVAEDTTHNGNPCSFVNNKKSHGEQSYISLCKQVMDTKRHLDFIKELPDWFWK
jgi:hypothetical protein